MTDSNSTTSTTSTTTDAYEKGTWQATLSRSASLFDKSTADRKKASSLLWEGAQDAINTWDSDSDVSAERLYGEVMDVLGKARKGDASKIKTVALAVRNNGLTLAIYKNLAAAYTEAVRLTKTVAAEAAEDDAAEKAIEAMEAPHTASTPENAAKIVLSKGVDEAARLLLDALGVENEAAHRSLLRAISNEIAGRIKPAPKPAAKAGPKAGAKQADTKAAAKAKPKAQPASTKAKPKPVSASNGDPNKKALPPKAQPATAQPATAKAKAKPVRRPARTAATQ